MPIKLKRNNYQWTDWIKWREMNNCLYTWKYYRNRHQFKPIELSWLDLFVVIIYNAVINFYSYKKNMWKKKRTGYKIAEKLTEEIFNTKQVVDRGKATVVKVFLRGSNLLYHPLVIVLFNLSFWCYWIMSFKLLMYIQFIVLYLDEFWFVCTRG